MKHDEVDLSIKTLPHGNKKSYVSPELVVHGSVEKITERTDRGSQWDEKMTQPYQYSP
jgi:hypothetical protein